MALWTPAAITTALWLDAADANTITLVSGNVSQWDDKSGNNNNATQGGSTAQPAYRTDELNGLNIIRFDGSDDIMSSPYVFNINNQSTFAVWRAVSGTAQSLMRMRPATNARWNMLSNSVTKGSGNISFTDGTDWRVLYLSGSSTQVLGSINGDLSPTTADDSNSGVVANTFIGGGNTSDGNNSIGVYSNVDVAELVCVAGTPDTDTRQTIEGYLAHRWGLEANLPAGHPYKRYPPGYVEPFRLRHNPRTNKVIPTLSSPTVTDIGANCVRPRVTKGY